MNWVRTASVTSSRVRPYARSLSGSTSTWTSGSVPADHDHPADAVDPFEARPDDVVGQAVQPDRVGVAGAGHGQVDDRRVVQVELDVAGLLDLGGQVAANRR